jgi:integrase
MKGIRRDRYGWRAYVSVGSRKHGTEMQREKRFPPDTPTATMQSWRDEVKIALRALVPSRSRGTLTDDARRYLELETVKGLASYASRICEIEAWLPLHGADPRYRLTKDDILAARQTWLAEGYAPKTINHRVRALRHLYRTLPGSPPFPEIKKLPEPKAQPIAVGLAVVRRVLKRLTDPQTIARFMVLVSTGQRPAQLKRAVRTDVDLRRRVWFVRPAKGGHPIPLALTDDMIAAWKAFIAADAWGDYDTSTHAKRLYEAGWPRAVRPYNAKHTIGILLAEAGAEWEDIRDYFGHTDIKTTRIYTGLIGSRLRTTSGLLEGRFGWGIRRKKPGSRRRTA